MIHLVESGFNHIDGQFLTLEDAPEGCTVVQGMFLTGQKQVGDSVSNI